MIEVEDLYIIQVCRRLSRLQNIQKVFAVFSFWAPNWCTDWLKSIVDSLCVEGLEAKDVTTES